MKGNINLYALKQKKNVIQQKLVIHLFEIFLGFFFFKEIVAQNKKKAMITTLHYCTAVPVKQIIPKN